jgi:hypothetical protein
MKILLSERNPLWSNFVCDVLADVMHDEQQPEVCCPNSIDVADLIRVALEQEWTFAILVMNNIYYSPDRAEGALIRDALNLIHEMHRRFHKPIIATYGYPDTPEYPNALLAAGATDVLRLPFSREQLRNAIVLCLQGKRD